MKKILVFCFEKQGKIRWTFSSFSLFRRRRKNWGICSKLTRTHNQRRLNQTLFPVAGSSNRILTTELLVRGQHTFFSRNVCTDRTHTWMKTFFLFRPSFHPWKSGFAKNKCFFNTFILESFYEYARQDSWYAMRTFDCLFGVIKISLSILVRYERSLELSGT